MRINSYLIRPHGSAQGSAGFEAGHLERGSCAGDTGQKAFTPSAGVSPLSTLCPLSTGYSLIRGVKHCLRYGLEDDDSNTIPMRGDFQAAHMGHDEL